MSLPEAPGTCRRGRPRSEGVKLAILRAAGELILEVGLTGFTIEGVAERAGASKVTIYKWWPSKGALALDGFFVAIAPAIEIVRTGDTEADLVAQIESVVGVFRDPRAGSLLAGLIGESQRDPELAAALRERWLDPRRRSGAEILQSGQAHGEFRADLDITLVLDQIYGALYLRLLLGHAPIPAGIGRDIVCNVVAGIRRTPPGKPEGA
jgi:AcrR family transcriptional regulator